MELITRSVMPTLAAARPQSNQFAHRDVEVVMDASLRCVVLCNSLLLVLPQGWCCLVACPSDRCQVAETATPCSSCCGPIRAEQPAPISKPAPPSPCPDR